MFFRFFETNLSLITKLNFPKKCHYDFFFFNEYKTDNEMFEFSGTPFWGRCEFLPGKFLGSKYSPFNGIPNNFFLPIFKFLIPLKVFFLFCEKVWQKQTKTRIFGGNVGFPKKYRYHFSLGSIVEQKIKCLVRKKLF